MHSQFSIHNGIDISVTRKREEKENKKNQQHNNNETNRKRAHRIYFILVFVFTFIIDWKPYEHVN